MCDLCLPVCQALSPFTLHKLVNPDMSSPNSLELVGVQLKGSVTQNLLLLEVGDFVQRALEIGLRSSPSVITGDRKGHQSKKY